MRKLLVLIAALVLILVPTIASAGENNEFCPPSGCQVKVTGGGWCDGGCLPDKISFGFNAQPTEDGLAKGQFQLVDHANKIRIHAEITWAAGCVVGSEVYSFTGTATINGEGAYLFVADLYDGGEPGALNGDRIAVSAGSNVYDCIIDGGNIQAHPK